MSVSLIEDFRISQLAHFAESVGLGSAQEVGDLIHEQNLKCFNARYTEENPPCFTLEQIEPETPERIYDLALWVASNSYYDLDNISEGEQMLFDIQNKAASNVGGHYDDVIGKRMTANHNGLRDNFLAELKGSFHATVLYFDTSDMQWCSTNVPVSMLKPYPEEQNRFDLTVEQTQDILSRIKKRNDDAIAKRNAEIEEQRIKQEEFNERFKQIVPEGSVAVIVAELLEDDCGHNDDYYGSIRTRRVVLAFSKHNRNLFPELRKAALNLKDTEFLSNPETSKEHRENYSMGRGTFLSSGSSYSGWHIRKVRLSANGTTDISELLDIDYSKTPKKKSTTPKTKKANTPIEIKEQQNIDAPIPETKTLNDNSQGNDEHKNIVSLSLEYGVIKLDNTKQNISLTPNFKLPHSLSKQLRDSGFEQAEGGTSWEASTSNTAIQTARNIATNGTTRRLF